MVRKRVPAHSSIEEGRRVRVFLDRAEVEYPVVLPMAMFQKLPCILTSVAIQTLDALRWISHDDDTVRDIG